MVNIIKQQQTVINLGHIEFPLVSAAVSSALPVGIFAYSNLTDLSINLLLNGIGMHT